MDLLTIAASDVNKPLLKNAIPVLIKALKLRGETNLRLVVDVVKTLLQLTFESSCRAVLLAKNKEVIALLQKLVISPKYDREALMSSQLLQNELNTVPGVSQTTSKSPSKFSGLVRRMRKDKTDGDGSKDIKRTSLSKSAAPKIDVRKKHVMLSYNWAIKEVVHHLDGVLRSKGVNTWLDIRDMKENLNDSMADAIENAYLVMVFMTAKYKESPNCRKECEYADGQGVPICYIMAEENYKPNGWLGIQLGKAIWIRAWSISVADASLPSLMERAKPGAVVLQPSENDNTDEKKEDTPVPTKSTTPNSDMMSLLTGIDTKMQTMMEGLKSLNDLNTKVESLKQSVDELKAQLNGRKN